LGLGWWTITAIRAALSAASHDLYQRGRHRAEGNSNY